jgi:hypothetical protein
MSRKLDSHKRGIGMRIRYISVTILALNEAQMMGGDIAGWQAPVDKHVISCWLPLVGEKVVPPGFGLICQYFSNGMQARNTVKMEVRNVPMTSPNPIQIRRR